MKRKLLSIIFIGLIAFISVSVLAVDNTTSVKPVLDLTVNGAQNARIGDGGTLTFTAKVTNSYTPGDTVTWSSLLDDSNHNHTYTSTLNNEGIAVLTLTYDELKHYAAETKDYVMQASYNTNEGVITNKVKFGLLGENPAVVFADPAFDIEVSLNDPIHFKAQTYLGAESTLLHLTWECSESNRLSTGYACPANDAEEADIAYKATGTYTIKATVIDQDGKSDYAIVRIKVVNDPPEVSLKTNKNPNLYEVSETATVSFTASDKFGTVNIIKWGCSNDGNIIYDNAKVLDPALSKTTTNIMIDLPNFETDSYKCSFKAVDDDAEEGVTSIVFKTHIPAQESTPPTEIKTDTKEETKKENAKTGDFIHIYVMMFIVSCIALCILRKRYN